MYPNFKYFIEEVFGIRAPNWFSLINTFGFFVALAFLIGAWILKKELQRKESIGLLQPIKPFVNNSKKYGNKNKSGQFPVYPHQRVGDIIFISLVGGLIGAKIFNAFETWDEFLSDPINNIFSGGGLTFYGGLIVAAVLIIYYCRKHQINLAHFCDAIAPALMIGYGIGRLGCHFAGDGDWGIFNSAFISLPDGAIKEATNSEFSATVMNASEYFNANFGENIPHAYLKLPNGIPSWLYAENFPHNVIKEGITIQNCDGSYCYQLPIPVFPTSLYEAILCVLLFLGLWFLRNKFRSPMNLFALYLILNGLERFSIEKIKVNYKYNWGIIHPTQSEIISIILILIGSTIFVSNSNFGSRLKN